MRLKLSLVQVWRRFARCIGEWATPKPCSQFLEAHREFQSHQSFDWMICRKACPVQAWRSLPWSVGGRLLWKLCEDPLGEWRYDQLYLLFDWVWPKMCPVRAWGDFPRCTSPGAWWRDQWQRLLDGMFLSKLCPVQIWRRSPGYKGGRTFLSQRCS